MQGSACTWEVATKRTAQQCRLWASDPEDGVGFRALSLADASWWVAAAGGEVGHAE